MSRGVAIAGQSCTDRARPRYDVHPRTFAQGASMNHTRRSFTLAGTAFALAASFSSLPARADDASDAKSHRRQGHGDCERFRRRQGLPDAARPGEEGQGRARLSADRRRRLHHRRLGRHRRAAGARREDRQLQRAGVLFDGRRQPRLPGRRRGGRNHARRQHAEGARLAAVDQAQARRRCLHRRRPEGSRRDRDVHRGLHFLLQVQGRVRQHVAQRPGDRRSREA